MNFGNGKLVRRTGFSLTFCGLACMSAASIADDVASFRGFDDNRQFELERDSLVISSSTYERTKGAVSTLAIGTTLPDSATATTLAVAGNNYVTVWNNANADASFGVTSPIELTDVDASSGRPLHRLRVP